MVVGRGRGISIPEDGFLSVLPVSLASESGVQSTPVLSPKDTRDKSSSRSLLPSTTAIHFSTEYGSGPSSLKAKPE